MLGKRLINTSSGGGFNISNLTQTQAVGTGASGDAFISSNGKWIAFGGFRYSPVWDYIWGVGECSTPHDLSTYSETSYALRGNNDRVTFRGLHINPNGNRYSHRASSRVYTYNLNTPGYIEPNVNTSFYNFAPDNYNTIQFNNDGTQNLFGKFNTATIWVKSNIDWRVDGTSLYSYTFPPVAGSNWNTMWGFSYNMDGTKFILNMSTEKTIYQYTLTTPYDLRTAVYDGISFFHNLTDAFFVQVSDDDSKVYICRQGAVYKFEM